MHLMHFVTLHGTSLLSTLRLMSNRNGLPVPTCCAIDHCSVPPSLQCAAYSIAPLENICIFESRYIVHSRRKMKFSGKTGTLHSINGSNSIESVGHLLQRTPAWSTFWSIIPLHFSLSLYFSNFVTVLWCFFLWPYLSAERSAIR